MSTQPIEHLTPAEYLAFERRTAQKHEYYLGEIFAMGGASRTHNRITANIGAQLNFQFRNRPCEEYIADMRVKIASDGKYVYPDIVATCHSPEFEDGHLDTLINPQVIVEVLSKSTELYDRTKKFESYRTIDSLRDYILVCQDRISVEHFHCDEDGNWCLRGHTALTDVLDLKSIDCRIPVADIYRKVQLDESHAPVETDDPKGRHLR